MPTSSTALALDPSLADQVAPQRDTFLSKGLWTDERMGARISEHADSRPETEAVVDRKGLRRISYAELDRLTNRFTNRMVATGIAEG